MLQLKLETNYPVIRKKNWNVTLKLETNYPIIREKNWNVKPTIRNELSSHAGKIIEMLQLKL